MIYSFEPFAVDKSKFGQYYNDHCSIVPSDEDWIQIKDYDCQILCPESFAVIDKVVEAHDAVADVLQRMPFLIYGAYTNRCSNEDQVIRFPGHEIRTHRAQAKIIAGSRDGHQAVPIERLSGHYLLFKKSYWLKNPIQSRPLLVGTTWDKAFTAGARGRMALIPGLYVYHQYRIGLRNTQDKSHLR